VFIPDHLLKFSLVSDDMEGEDNSMIIRREGERDRFFQLWFGSRESNRGLLKEFYCLGNCGYGKEESFEVF